MLFVYDMEQEMKKVNAEIPFWLIEKSQKVRNKKIGRIILNYIETSQKTTLFKKMLKLSKMLTSIRNNIDSFYILHLPSSVISESSKNSKIRNRKGEEN